MGKLTWYGLIEEKVEDFNVLVEEHELAWSIYETNRFTARLSGEKKGLGMFPMVRQVIPSQPQSRGH
jgi:hypothetical protein